MSLIAVTAVGRGALRRLVYPALTGSLFITWANACVTDCAIDVFFTGNYIDETCEVAINNASSNESVRLPQLSAVSLSRDGSEAGSVPFDITLKDCPVSRTVTLYFNSAVSAADGETGNLLNTSGTDFSTGVQIRLRKEDSSQIVIDDASSGQNYVISSTADPLSHRFTASYYAKGNSTVSAGQVRAVAGVELIYK